MSRFCIVLLSLIFSLNISWSQEITIIPGSSIDGIEFNFSTRPDVREKYKDYTILDTLTRDCPHTITCSDFYTELNSIWVKELGIVFQTDYETQEIVNKVLLVSPFKGSITKKLKFEIGKTKVYDLFAIDDSYSITSTNRKEYWIIKKDYHSFLVNRNNNDPDYPIDPTIIFEREIVATILYKSWPALSQSECLKPIFAPREETHKNCYTRVHKGGIYYLPIGDESPYKAVKNGFWKTFYPNHKLREEGNYKKGLKIGKFKYYDEQGNLIDTRNHSLGYLKIYKWWIFLPLAVIVPLILFVLKKIKKNYS